MSVAAIGALVIGEAEEAAAVVFLFPVGELLESIAADRTRAGIKALSSLVPKTAILLDAQGQQRQVLATALLFLIIAHCSLLNATKLFYQNFVETAREQRRHQSQF